MKHSFFYGWVVVLAGALIWALSVGMFQSFGVFFKPISSEFDWSRGLTSGGFTLFAVLMGFFSPLTGKLVDKYGPRIVILLGGCVMGLGFILLSQMHSVWQFYLYFVMVGASMGAFFTPISATIIRWFRERQGLALGFTTLGGGIGIIALPPLAQALISAGGWRYAYFILGLGVGSAIVLTSLLFRRPPEGNNPGVASLPNAEPAVASFSLGQALSTPAFWSVFLAAGFSILAYQALMVHLVPYATDKGIEPMKAAMLVSIVGASNMVGRVSWGALSDRIGRKTALILAFGLGAGLVLWLWLWNSTAILIPFAALFGFAQGGWFVTWSTLQGELFGMGSLGAILGATQTGTSIGAGLGALLAGYIFDLTGGYRLAFLMAAIALILASLLILGLKEPRR